jgi:hypothetical protein
MYRYIHIDRQTDKQPDRTDRQIDRYEDTEIERYEDTEIERYGDTDR